MILRSSFRVYPCSIRAFNAEGCLAKTDYERGTRKLGQPGDYLTPL